MNKEVFVGLDWAVKTHALCAIDAAGQVLARKSITHDRQGLAELMTWLARFGEHVCIAIPIHPNAVKASRPRYRCHGGKSDPGDAYLLADLLRTDGHRWQALTPSPMPFKRCACSCVRATSWCERVWSCAISSTVCCNRSGPALRRSSRTSRSPSPWPS